MKFEDLTSKSFGELVVIERVENYIQPCGRSKVVWLCQCSCGNLTKVQTATLKTGNTKSCGCMQLKGLTRRAPTHGMSNTKEYRAWRSMRNRCYNVNVESYELYGGRGIYVCQEWIESFETFYADMGSSPEGSLLDRIDPNGNYCPENCRWVDASVSSFNKRVSAKNKSGKEGVTWCKRMDKWKVAIKKEHLGYFEDFDDAVAKREEYEVKYYGFIKE